MEVPPRTAGRRPPHVYPRSNLSLDAFPREKVTTQTDDNERVRAESRLKLRRLDSQPEQGTRPKSNWIVKTFYHPNMRIALCYFLCAGPVGALRPLLRRLLLPLATSSGLWMDPEREPTATIKPRVRNTTSELIALGAVVRTRKNIRPHAQRYFSTPRPT